MAFVPSGKRRLSKTSRQLSYNPTGMDDNEVEQESVSFDGQPLAPVDFDALQKQINTPNENLPPSRDNISDAVSDDSASDMESHLEHYIMKQWESLGVPGRKYRDRSDKLFQYTVNLEDGSYSGFYFLPTYVMENQVTPDQAMDIAKSIGEKFNLQQDMTKENGNYKITFKTRQSEPEKPVHGTSFDSIGEDTGSRRKAAESKHSLIKSSQNQTIEFLMNQLRGDK